MCSSYGGRPRIITCAQRRAFVRTIVVDGLDNDADVRNTLSEQLNVIVSTNIVRCALHEASMGH